MATTYETPNMELVLPIPGQEPGPDYANDNNAAFEVIDSHTHVAGQGLPVPVAGLNINADLPCQNNNVTGQRSSRFNSTSAALSLVTDKDCVYVCNGDLYYNDGNGNQVRMTIAGAVNTSGSGSISGMGSTTAAATYTSASSTFAFTSASGTPANFSTGPLILGRNASGTFTVTLTPAAGQTSNFSLTLPSALPGASNSFVLSDTSGNLSFGSLTKALLPSVGQQTSSGTSGVSVTSTTFVDVSGSSVSITTTGRPVFLTFQPQSGSSTGGIQLLATGGAASTGTVALLRDGAIIAQWSIWAASGAQNNIATLTFTDFTASSGSHTYKLQGKLTNPGQLGFATNVLIAYEQ